MSDAILKEILGELKELKKGQNETNQRLGKLETDVSTLKEDVSVLKEKASSLEEKFESLEGKFESLENKFESLDERTSNLERDVTRIKASVINIENNHSKQLNALFDSYTLLYEVSCVIRTDLARMAATQEHQDFRIKWIDNMMKKTS